MAAGMLPAQLGRAASAPIAALEIAMIWDLASFLTCSIMASTSWPAAIAAGREASSAAIAVSAQPTTPAMPACMAPSAEAQASRHPAAWPTWAPTRPTLTKYFVHAPEMTFAKSPCP